MRTRLLATALALVCSGAIAAAQERPPSIEYGDSRASARWIELPGHGAVAVDDGIEWEGVKVYLSLTDDLVAVDAATGKPLWWRSVGAFWSRLGFEEVEVEGAAESGKVWAVALQPRCGEGERVQHHDLRTGEPIRVPGRDPEPAGTPLAPPRALSGSEGVRAAPFRGIVTTDATWREAARRIFGEADAAGIVRDLGPLGPGEAVLIVYEGARTNCRGVECARALEDDGRILVRLRHLTYQSGMSPPTEHPYGVFVLPLRPGKTVVVERNAQRYIGGPPIWREEARLEVAGHPAGELEGLGE